MHFPDIVGTRILPGARIGAVFFLLMGTVFGSGCESTVNPALSSPGSDLALKGKHVPLPEVDWVLDGTDLVELSDFEPQPLDADMAGRYLAQPGGAELSLRIHSEGQQWVVRREYREPEISPQVRVYRATLRDGALVSGESGLHLRGTEGGLLVFEGRSGVDMIPPDFWILYLREP